jgi:two-component system chemotaxis response regulator CheY
MVKTPLGTLSKATFSEAASGPQAIETLAIPSVHLVLLDLKVPDMHGLDVPSRLSRSTGRPVTPPRIVWVHIVQQEIVGLAVAPEALECPERLSLCREGRFVVRGVSW